MLGGVRQSSCPLILQVLCTGISVQAHVHVGAFKHAVSKLQSRSKTCTFRYYGLPALWGFSTEAGWPPAKGGWSTEPRVRLDDLQHKILWVHYRCVDCWTQNGFPKRVFFSTEMLNHKNVLAQILLQASSQWLLYRALPTRPLIVIMNMWVKGMAQQEGHQWSLKANSRLRTTEMRTKRPIL